MRQSSPLHFVLRQVNCSWGGNGTIVVREPPPPIVWLSVRGITLNKHDREEGSRLSEYRGKPSVTTFIAVSNRRGGVGKTTVTMMLAYGLSVGRR